MKTYKFKLYSAKRNKKLHRQINAAALAWNHCVALTRRYYKSFGKSLPKFKLQKHLTKLKTRTPYAYLTEIGSQALQEVTDRLYKSYERFLMPGRTAKNTVFRDLEKFASTNPSPSSKQATNCCRAIR
jgi:putative transposase